MQELFRMETEGQAQLLTAGLLALERDPGAAAHLESCMRAAHSLKGAAAIVGLSAGVAVAHAMESCFVAAQRGETGLYPRQIDLLLAGVDLLTRISATPEANADRWAGEGLAEIERFIAALSAAAQGGADGTTPEMPLLAATPEMPLLAATPQVPPLAPTLVAAELAPPLAPTQISDRALRVAARDLDRLLGLASEVLLESRWLKPFADSLLRLKRMQQGMGKTLDDLRAAVGQPAGGRVQQLLAALRLQAADSRHYLTDRLAELEVFDSQSTELAHRLYDEMLATRMQPFADGVRGFPRMLRTLARTLDKQVRLETLGEATKVDRDILEKLEIMLGHLLRNAIDHGIEPPAERREAGKPAEGTIRLEARHGAGMLQIIVSDDGRGIDLDRLRQAAVALHLTNAAIVDSLPEDELLQFLFLPGFTMKGTVTDISGRGVGLDAVQTMVKEVQGTIRVSSLPGGGTRFQLQLPLTLSVVRALLVQIGGEAYAFPLAYITRGMKWDRKGIELIEGRQHVRVGDWPVALVDASQLFGCTLEGPDHDEHAIVVLGGSRAMYGLVVDRFLGERELVVQPLDSRLGKVRDIAAGALMQDGSPVLIVDVADLLRSIDKVAAGGGLSRLQHTVATATQMRKRVLVVDDSLTVRELQRKLLDQHGYDAESAVDGLDGWNAVRTGHFDLVITDVDMPRLNGIELVRLIRNDAQLRSLPVMIVSSKDRADDQRLGLEAGADYYLTKGGFQDETLVQAVIDLIGAASR
jgi:two-component system, chemotaxis family, sensor histidine kinase and response regulator WspE